MGKCMLAKSEDTGRFRCIIQRATTARPRNLRSRALQQRGRGGREVAVPQVLFVDPCGGVEAVAQAQEGVRDGLGGARGGAEHRDGQGADDGRDEAPRPGALVLPTPLMCVRGTRCVSGALIGAMQGAHGAA